MRYVLMLLLFFCFSDGFPQSAIARQSQPTEVFRKPKLKRIRLKPSHPFLLNGKIPEGSGLVAWDGLLWTHNDSDSESLFALDTASGTIVNEYPLPRVKNRDWEDLSQDSDYFYLGAFGNNLGKNDTLQILRIGKASLLEKKPAIDFITFVWPETLTKGRVRKTNFNCEAMVVVNDSIFLFTKEMNKGRRTRLFSLPAVPGTYTAHYKSTLKTRVLVTGATYNADLKKLVLCGYNLWLHPFLLVFPEVNGTDFFAGRETRIRLRLRFHQVEGVSSFDGKKYYFINEKWKFFFLHSKQELHSVEL